jgi:hypothetical protein
MTALSSLNYAASRSSQRAGGPPEVRDNLAVPLSFSLNSAQLSVGNPYPIGES